MDKITKKEYFNLIENTKHYLLGNVYGNENVEVETLLNKVLTNDLTDKNTFNNKDFIKNNCKYYIGAKQNTKWFLHKIEGSNEFCYEEKLGKFFKLVINDILYIIHKKNNVVSFKCII